MISKLKPKSEFSRNVLTLMTGTTIAQAIPIAISPILTRLYTPEDFGVFALYLSVLGLLAVIATARYELAIVLPKSDEKAINILSLSVFITFSLTFLTALIVYIFKDNILNLFNAKELGNLLYLLPISLLLSGLYQSFNYWSNRKKYFKNMGNSRIAQSIGVGIGQLGFGYSSIFGGMIFGNILGRILSVATLVKQFFYYDKKLLRKIDKTIMINQMKKHKDFPLVNSFHVFSDVAKTSISTILISSFFGSAILGFYALSLRVLQAPLGIIGSSFGQVLYQRFNEAKQNNQSLYPIAKSILIKLAIIALPIFGILYYIAPDLFGFIFGEKWRVAGVYTQILLPYLFINFLLSPISQIPIILGEQKQYFLVSLFGNTLFLLIIYLYRNAKILYLFSILSIVMSLFYLAVMYWYYIIIRKDIQNG